MPSQLLSRSVHASHMPEQLHASHAGPAPHPVGRHRLPNPPVFKTGWVREVSSRVGFGATAPCAQRTNDRIGAQRTSERRGRLAEAIASAFLMVKGYRIIARRVRTPLGELDLIAVRGRRLAFVEVKYRDTLAAATRSVGRRQATRTAAAAARWYWRHPAYRGYRIGLDALYLAPWRIPRHRIDALQPL